MRWRWNHNLSTSFEIIQIKNFVYYILWILNLLEKRYHFLEIRLLHSFCVFSTVRLSTKYVREQETHSYFWVSLIGQIYKWYYMCLHKTRRKNGGSNSCASTWHCVNFARVSETVKNIRTRFFISRTYCSGLFERLKNTNNHKCSKRIS